MTRHQRRFLQEHASYGDADFSSDGKTLIVASGGKENWDDLVCWDAATGQTIGEAIKPSARLALGFSYFKIRRDGRVVVTAGLAERSPDRYMIQLWDARTGKATSEWLVRADRIRALALSPDGRFIALAPDSPQAEPRPYEVWLFEAATGKPLGEP